MEMEKLRTQRGFILLPEDTEEVIGKSQTVPSETMTIREILTKFSRGQRVDVEMRREGRFEENSTLDSEDLEAASRLSLTDRDEVAERMRQKNSELERTLQLRKKELANKKLAQKEAEQQKTAEKYLFSEKQKPNPPDPGNYVDRGKAEGGDKADGWKKPENQGRWACEAGRVKG